MKIKYALFLLFCVYSTLHAQETVSADKNLFKINVFLPGFVYEHGFTEKNTLYSELSVDYTYRYNSFVGNTWSFTPYIREQFRHYYNFQKRSDKGKRTLHNSANFIALHGLYNFESISTNENFSEYRPSLTVAPVWGFQRTYKGGFNLDLHLGVGYLIDNCDNRFVPVGNFTMGWIIGK